MSYRVPKGLLALEREENVLFFLKLPLEILIKRHQKCGQAFHLDAGSVRVAGGSKAATPMPQKQLSSSFPVLETLPQKSAQLPHPLQSNARSSQDNS